MAKFALVVFLLVKSANCAFFDLTDVDDPLSLLWHTKGEFILINLIISAREHCRFGHGTKEPVQCHS